MLHIYNLAPGGDDCVRAGGGSAASPVAPRPDRNGDRGIGDANLVNAPES